MRVLAKPGDFVVATDASMDALAAVRAPCNAMVVKELLRFCLWKGAWSKLLPPHLAWLRQHDLLEQSEELPDYEFLCNPLWRQLPGAFPCTEDEGLCQRREETVRKAHLCSTPLASIHRCALVPWSRGALAAHQSTTS